MRNIENLNKEKTNCFNIDLSTCKFLGQGRSGRVYLLPNGKALKIFSKEKNCNHEYEILKSVEGNKHFPKVYEYSSNCMIREYVGGTEIEDYIREYGLSVNLVKNIVELIEDFRKLGFTKLDIRCRHIFIQQDVAIRLIDPRQTYTKVVPYPYSILKTLDKLGVLVDFFNILKNISIELYEDWSTRYVYDKKNHVHY